MSVAREMTRSVLDELNGLKEKSPRAWLAIFTAVVCVYLAEKPYLEPEVRWLAVGCFAAALMLAGHVTGRILQIAGAAFMIWMAAADTLRLANHGFVICYFAAFFAVCPINREGFWSHGVWFTRAIFALLMGAALLHKLVSVYFMSGNQIADLLLSGQGYLQIMGLVFSNMVQIVTDTRIALHTLYASYDLQQSGGRLPLPELGLGLMFVIQAMTWVSVFLQGLLEVAAIFYQRFGIWLHRLIFCFSLVVYSLRPENIFLCMNLMMGFALTDDRSKSMRLPYLVAIAYLLIADLLNFRPLLLQ